MQRLEQCVLHSPMAALAFVLGILLCSGTTAVDASPRFAFADVLSDGMVLQAAPSFSVLWGRAPSFLGRMTVRIDGVEVLLDEAVQEQAWLRDNGSHIVTWHLELPPQPAGGPHELQVDAEFWDESITLAGVLFGDVFICGGQSNMQMGMSQAHRHDMADVTAAAADGALQNIRMLTVDLTEGQPNLFPDSAQARMFYTDYTTEYHTLPLLHGWEPVLPFSYFGPPAANSTREQTYLPQGFSIVCLMFGIETFQRAGGIRPVGLISASCGGSAIEYHMPHSGLVQCLHLAPPHSERLGYLPYDILEDGTPHPLGRIPPGSDGILFAHGIAPLSRMAVTAFLWYQGESNVLDPDTYQCLLAALITSWRAAFPQPRHHKKHVLDSGSWSRGQQEVDGGETIFDGIRHTGTNATPFLMVQLAPDTHSEGLLVRQRQAQLNVVRAGHIDNVAIVPAFDLGDPHSPSGAQHPRSKVQVARRLAAAAQVLALM